MRKEVTITFKNLSDFRSRIANLWQTQQEDEIYNCVFPDEETELEFNNLVACFKTEG